MGCIYKRGQIWWVQYCRDGQRFRESAGSKLRDDAVKMLRIREGHLAEGRPFTPTALKMRFEDLAADLRNDYADRGPRGARRLKHELAHLEISFTGWRARQITTDAIRGYIARRQEEGAANGTINRELAALKRAFNLAIAAGKLWHRPHVPMLRENNVRKGFFESEMFEAVRAELPDHLYGVMTFGYYTGWRKSEILGLRWSQVNLPHGEVRLEPGTTKNRDGRVLFLEGELRDVLEQQWKHRAPNCEYVFHRHGRRMYDFEKAWAKACEEVDRTLRVQEEKRCGAEGAQLSLPRCQGLLFHDLRRTAVRNMVRAGIPERVAMKISGHKTRAIFDRYHIVSESDLREAAFKLAAYGGAVAVENERLQPQFLPHPDSRFESDHVKLLKPQGRPR